MGAGSMFALSSPSGEKSWMVRLVGLQTGLEGENLDGDNANNWVGFGIPGRLLGGCRVRCARLPAFCSFKEGRKEKLQG